MPASGKGTNILVDELYGLLTLKDFVNSAWYVILMPFEISAFHYRIPAVHPKIGRAERRCWPQKGNRGN